MKKRIVFVLFIVAAVGGAVWAVVRLDVARRNRLKAATENAVQADASLGADAWAAAIEKAKEPRLEDSGGLVVPAELRHYSERYWFLATQVAEIEKYQVHTCQDYLDLAGLIQRGEVVPVPAVTDTYVLMGVGQKADDSVFTRYADEDADENKPARDESSGSPETQQKLLSDYQTLQTLAQNFGGRSYNIDDPPQRQELKINMLRSLRPQALKVLEQVASVYHAQFGRPLPVSSLVRPEQYQHALRRVNRNAVLIDSPPHSTGLAFDIDYRYMGASEQTFLMAELARMKTEGRIEVIRERNANYHVFAFINGTRPADDLITASLEKAGAPVEEAHHTGNPPAKSRNKAVKARSGRKNTSRAKAQRRKEKR